MSGRRAAALAVLAVAAAPAAAGCDGGGGGDRPAIDVSAASSLTLAFTRYGHEFRPARVRLSFGGSDTLAAQIRQGARPDVFAAANTTVPAALHADHLVGRPVDFARNRLVLAVPAHGARVHGLSDLARPGVTIAVGQPGVPVGDYTRKVLAKLPAGERAAIERNFRSQEPDVSGVVGKLAQGAVDAGFVYVTDVRATNGRLRAIRIPDRLKPEGTYAVAVVRGAAHPGLARRFIAGLLHGQGAGALRAAGFAPPP